MTDFVSLAKEQKERLTKLVGTYINGDPSSGAEVQPYYRKMLSDAMDEGYSLWCSGSAPLSNPVMLQKCFRNDNGDKLYYIDLYLWDMCREFGSAERRWGVIISPEVQFYRGERHGPTERPVNVKCFVVKGERLKDIEDFFAGFYQKMECVPYETRDSA